MVLQKMVKAPVMEKKPTPKAIDPVSLGDKIRDAAYYRFLNRGGKHGNDLSDWLEAEKQIKRECRMM